EAAATDVDLLSVHDFADVAGGQGLGGHRASPGELRRRGDAAVVGGLQDVAAVEGDAHRHFILVVIHEAVVHAGVVAEPGVPNFAGGVLFAVLDLAGLGKVFHQFGGVRDFGLLRRLDRQRLVADVQQHAFAGNV